MQKRILGSVRWKGYAIYGVFIYARERIQMRLLQLKHIDNHELIFLEILPQK